MLFSLSIFRRCVPFHLCIGPGSARADREGTWPGEGGRLEGGQTQTPVPSCLRGRDSTHALSLFTGRHNWRDVRSLFCFCLQLVLSPVLLTECVVEGIGDRFIPLALEEGETYWRHAVLVLSVEIQSLECAIGQRMAAKGRRFKPSV